MGYLTNILAKKKFLDGGFSMWPTGSELTMRRACSDQDRQQHQFFFNAHWRSQKLLD